MQEALGKTFQLAKEHPYVLAPLAASCWFSYYLQWARKAATHIILHRFLIGHSVLGIDVPAPDPTYAYVHKAMIVLTPFSFAIEFLVLALSVASLVMTASLVRNLLAGEAMQWRAAVAFLAARKGRVALFTLLSQLLVMAAVALAAMAIPLIPGLQLYSVWALHVARYLILVVFAWCAMPFAMRLIAMENAGPVSAESMLQCRVVALAASILCVLLADVVKSRTGSLNLALRDLPALGHHVVWPLIAVVSSLPLGLLWIYLVVQGHEQNETVAA